MRQRRSRASGGLLFLLRQKKYAKRGAEDALYCALTRANFRPLRGLNALFGRKNVIFPIAYGSDKCTTRICGQTAIILFLLISGIPGQSHSCIGPYRRLQKRTGRTESFAPCKDLQWNKNILHHRRIRRCVLYSTAACFAISLRGNCFRWERCLHAGGAVVQFCRQFIVCWPQRFSAGPFCGTAVQSDPHPGASFCPLFLARQKKWVCEATVAV